MLTRISDVGRMLNVPVHTLRHWQEVCRIRVARTKGGQRWYDQRAIQRFRLVKQLRKEGYALYGARDRLRQLEDWR